VLRVKHVLAEIYHGRDILAGANIIPKDLIFQNTVCFARTRNGQGTCRNDVLVHIAGIRTFIRVDAGKLAFVLEGQIAAGATPSGVYYLLEKTREI